MDYPYRFTKTLPKSRQDKYRQNRDKTNTDIIEATDNTCKHRKTNRNTHKHKHRHTHANTKI